MTRYSTYVVGRGSNIPVELTGNSGVKVDMNFSMFHLRALMIARLLCFRVEYGHYLRITIPNW